MGFSYCVEVLQSAFFPVPDAFFWRWVGILAKQCCCKLISPCLGVSWGQRCWNTSLAAQVTRPWQHFKHLGTACTFCLRQYTTVQQCSSFTRCNYGHMEYHWFRLYSQFILIHSYLFRFCGWETWKDEQLSIIPIELERPVQNYFYVWNIISYSFLP